MKTTKATIKIVNRAGYLFISVSWHGRVFKSTQYKCPLKWWNNKAEQCTSKCPNYRIINFEINKLKNKLIECRDKYIISGKPYTAQMLCDCLDMVDYNGNSREWKNIVSEAISSKGLGLSSSLLYKTVTTSLNGFFGNDSFTIDDITTDRMKRYMKYLKDTCGVSDNTIRTYFSRIRAIINYSIESDIIDVKNNPFIHFKWIRETKKSVRHIALTKKQMDMMIDYLMCRLIVMDGSLWSWNEDAVDRMVNVINSVEHVLSIFILSYLCQGLSPVDLFKLKVCDLSFDAIGGDDYYIIHTHRSKTHVPVDIYIKKDIRSMAIIHGYLMHYNGEFLLPDFISSSEAHFKQRRGYFFSVASKVLRNVAGDINRTIIENNVNNNLNDELINLELTPYSARHTFATVMINSGCSLNDIASLMGRSVEGLSDYIKELTKAEDVIKVRNKANL